MKLKRHLKLKKNNVLKHPHSTSMMVVYPSYVYAYTLLVGKDRLKIFLINT